MCVANTAAYEAPNSDLLIINSWNMEGGGGRFQSELHWTECRPSESQKKRAMLCHACAWIFKCTIDQFESQYLHTKIVISMSLCTGLSFECDRKVWQRSTKQQDVKTKTQTLFVVAVVVVVFCCCCGCYAKNSQIIVFSSFWIVQSERINSYWLPLLTPIRESTLNVSHCVQHFFMELNSIIGQLTKFSTFDIIF